jgi:hypothetical protein
MVELLWKNRKTEGALDACQCLPGQKSVADVGTGSVHVSLFLSPCVDGSWAARSLANALGLGQPNQRCFFQLVFSVRTVFFSHNRSANNIF